MRIFKLTFLLLTILVILSAVDVGECGKFKNFFKKIGKGFKKVGKAVVKGVKAIPGILGGVKEVQDNVLDIKNKWKEIRGN
ncbi:unnamed protein product [Cylicocyclus nassatus]|uniref:Uncharacterized protein n=1 Tax=Cylicocyclus nassatus TaxID=53992 RepID=A0AA36M024_CYLNA|nr:unnamed protein product [Cylicocyclus nassatus]